MSGQDFWTSPRDRRQIDAIANAWRVALCCNNELSPHLLTLLEHRLPIAVEGFSIRIVEDALGGSEPAKASFYPPEIWMLERTYRDAMSNNRRARFTLAHELGHIVMHSGPAVGRASAGFRSAIPRVQSSEWQANQFAASFLMPEEITRCYEAPIAAAEAMLVSVEAAEIRMRELGLWPASGRQDGSSRKELPAEVTAFIATASKGLAATTLKPRSHPRRS